MLDVFVERKWVAVGRRVVGLKEGEVEVMPTNGYVQEQADAAHSKLFIILTRNTCLSA
jgi:hypothetical protein